MVKTFSRASSRYAACMDNPFFGFGCNVDGPLVLLALLLLCAAAPASTSSPA